MIIVYKSNIRFHNFNFKPEVNQIIAGVGFDIDRKTENLLIQVNIDSFRRRKFKIIIKYNIFSEYCAVKSPVYVFRNSFMICQWFVRVFKGRRGREKSSKINFVIQK